MSTGKQETPTDAAGEAVRNTVDELQGLLGNIRGFAAGLPLDTGDRDFMNGNLKKVRKLVSRLGGEIEAVGK